MNDLKSTIEARLIQQELERRERLSSPSNIIDVRDRSFIKQDPFVADESRAVAAQCTRRAGKSSGLARRFLHTMQRYPGCFCPYVALTFGSAKNIMWPILEQVNDQYELKAKMTESDLTMTLPNGSRLQLFGADTKNFIRRLKGIKTPGAAVDECQDFSSHLEALVDDVLGPATLDYTDGWIALTGTPGPVLNGYFYEVTEKGMHGFSVHKWSLFDNPYLPDPRGFVNDLIFKKNWPHDHPTLLREYYGQWVEDPDILVFKYTDLNHYDAIPVVTSPWEYTIGVDIGFNDADAISIIGWNKGIKAAYLIEESVDREQGITELVEKLNHFIAVYNPTSVVMDTGGLGKKIAEEMRKRYSLPIIAADKTRKIENIELLNDAMRTGKFFAKRDSHFAHDCKRVKWDFEKSTPEKLVISDSFHSDINDSVLYNYKLSMHWLYEAEAPAVKIGTPVWLKKQQDEAIEYLENKIKSEKETDPWAGDNPWAEKDEAWTT